MKKIFLLFLSSFLFYAFFTLDTRASAAIKENSKDKVVKINERLFIAQTNDIYMNAEDYLGKTISYEGIYKTVNNEDSGEILHFVIRYGPGCCAYDAEAGFEVVWDKEWPQDDDWCEVTGVLEQYKADGQPFLRLALTSLKVLKKRGMERVKM